MEGNSWNYISVNEGPGYQVISPHSQAYPVPIMPPGIGYPYQLWAPPRAAREPGDIRAEQVGVCSKY